MNSIKIHAIPHHDQDSNTYILSEKGHGIIIDPTEYELIVDYVSSNNIDIDMIWITHEHFDHILALEAIREEYKVPVYGSAIASERIQNRKTNLSGIYDMLIYFRKGITSQTRHPRFECAACEVTFDEEYELEWQGHKFFFKRFPGHSPGSTLINMDGDSIFCGDYLLKDDPDVCGFNGGSQEDYQKYTRPYLLNLPVGTKIYPGHGETFIWDGSMEI